MVAVTQNALTDREYRNWENGDVWGALRRIGFLRLALRYTNYSRPIIALYQRVATYRRGKSKHCSKSSQSNNTSQPNRSPQFIPLARLIALGV